ITGSFYYLETFCLPDRVVLYNVEDNGIGGYLAVVSLDSKGKLADGLEVNRKKTLLIIISLN
ncbi:hypothetical protein H0E87_009289, partial [Populus deltoides]